MSGMDSISNTSTGQAIVRLYQSNMAWPSAFSRTPHPSLPPEGGRSEALAELEERVAVDAAARHLALQLGEGLVLDLAHPFAREAQAIAQHLERFRLALVQAEAALQDLLLAVRQGVDP